MQFSFNMSPSLFFFAQPCSNTREDAKLLAILPRDLCSSKYSLRDCVEEQGVTTLTPHNGYPAGEVSFAATAVVLFHLAVGWVLVWGAMFGAA
jgi:hypothetical protein